MRTIRKARHYKFTEITKLVTGRKDDPLMKRHVEHCAICRAHAKTAAEAVEAARQIMEDE